MDNGKSDTAPSLPIQTKKPWYVYLMAAWVFFGLGNFMLSSARVLTDGNLELLQYYSIAILVVVAVMLVNVIRMHKNYLITFGVLCVLMALWRSVNVVALLQSEIPDNPIIYFLLIFIVISAIMAVLSLRPSFLNRAVSYRAYTDQEATRKFAMKKMR